MYNIIANIINHVLQDGKADQYIYYICGALIVLFAVVFIDIVRDIFLGFFRG